MQGWYKTYHYYFRYLAFIFTCLVMIGCATTRTSIKEDVDVLTEADQGYLLISIDTNRSLKSVRIYGKQDFVLTQDDVQSGTNYILLPLEAGNYYIDKVEVNDWMSYRFEEDNWSFKIEKGLISYVGDFVFQGRGRWSRVANVELENNSSSAYEFMMENFSNILASRQIRYRGPGSDEFFEFIESIESTEEGKE